jgi:hypothetical protein
LLTVKIALTKIAAARPSKRRYHLSKGGVIYDLLPKNFNHVAPYILTYSRLRINRLQCKRTINYN